MTMMDKIMGNPRVSTDDEQMRLAKMFNGASAQIPGTTPVKLVDLPLYAPYRDGDALAVLVKKNVIADFGPDGYARGWKWDSYVNAVFTDDEPPPAPSK